MPNFSRGGAPSYPLRERIEAATVEAATKRAVGIVALQEQAKRLGVDFDPVAAIESGTDLSDLRNEVLEAVLGRRDAKKVTTSSSPSSHAPVAKARFASVPDPVQSTELAEKPQLRGSFQTCES